VSEGHRRALSATVARDHRAHGEVRQEGHHRGPRQQPARLVKYLDNIPESEIVELNIPDRYPSRLRARRQPQAVEALLPRGSGRHRGGHEGRRQTKVRRSSEYATRGKQIATRRRQRDTGGEGSAPESERCRYVLVLRKDFRGWRRNSTLVVRSRSRSGRLCLCALPLPSVFSAVRYPSAADALFAQFSFENPIKPRSASASARWRSFAFRRFGMHGRGVILAPWRAV